MKYTPATIAKALMAFITAFGGAAATSGPHDLVAWLGCIGAGLVAGTAVFATPNKTTDTPVPSTQDILTGLNDIRDHVTSQIDDISTKANDALGQVISMTGASIPGIDLVTKILSGYESNEKN